MRISGFPPLLHEFRKAADGDGPVADGVFMHVLCGARTPEQAIDNAGALHIALEGADAVQMKWDVDAIS